MDYTPLCFAACNNLNIILCSIKRALICFSCLLRITHRSFERFNFEYTSKELQHD